MSRTTYQILVLAVLLTLQGCVSQQTLTALQLKGPIVRVQLKNLAPTQPEACTVIKPLHIPAADYPVAAEQAGILPDDFLSLQQTVANIGMTITVRDANKSCASHLRAGVASKGHHVLTKTFTAASLSSKYQYLAGTVSTLSEKPKPGEQLQDPLSHRYLTENGQPLTCDYDLMDVTGANGERVAGESSDDLQLRNKLNEHLPWRGQPPHPVTRIMHGAQAEYSNYLRVTAVDGQAIEEPLTWLNRPESPLTAFRFDGEVYRLQNIEDALNFYRCQNITIPPEWNLQY